MYSFKTIKNEMKEQLKEEKKIQTETAFVSFHFISPTVHIIYIHVDISIHFPQPDPKTTCKYT